jgi:predicted RNA-binding protein
MLSKEHLYKKFVVPFWENELSLTPPPIELVAFTPTQTLKLLNHPIVKSFHEYITSNFTPMRRYKFALIVPCDAYKPYLPNLTKSELYKRVYEFANGRDIHIITLSDPLGIQPQEFHNFIFNEQKIFYDCVGLFREFSKFLKLRWNDKDYNKCVRILTEKVYLYFTKNKDFYEKIIALCIKGNPEFDIISLANKILNNKIITLPTFSLKEEFSSVEEFFKKNRKIYVKKEVFDELQKVVDFEPS